MRFPAKILTVAAVLGLVACAPLGAFLNSIPPPTPQEQCVQGGGRWHMVTTYDANGIATVGGACISHAQPQPAWGTVPAPHEIAPHVKPQPAHPAILKPTPKSAPKKAAPCDPQKDKDCKK